MPAPSNGSVDQGQEPWRFVGRLEFDVTYLGLPRPPCRVRAKVLANARPWVVIVSHPGHPYAPVREWLLEAVPGEAQASRSLPHVFRLVVRDPPASWSRFFGVHAAREITVDPDGTVHARIAGGQDLLRALEAGPAPQPSPRAGPGPPSLARLTRRQREAVQAAFAAGFFDVPRRVTLQELARRLGMSPSALSELLRRAVGRILQGADGFDGSSDGTPAAGRVRTQGY